MFRSKIIRLTSLIRNVSVLKQSALRRIAIPYPSVNNDIRCCASLPTVQNNEKPQEHENSGKLQIVFTCTVCNTRNSRKFSKVSYEKGIVIVECDGCGNNHLIADNLGWFPDTKCKNIEEIMAAKGEKIKKIEGCWEIKTTKN